MAGNRKGNEPYFIPFFIGKIITIIYISNREQVLIREKIKKILLKKPK